MVILVDAMAPTNFLLSNPAALICAVQTGGRSVTAGARNFESDVIHNGGRPRQVDASSFEVGRNLAATPGKVVYRNALMELIREQRCGQTRPPEFANGSANETR